ncbi:endonuclease NucS [Kingella kingae]|uniref:endonuclease NucS domain-containing protein n=1 Tax=Kingella kingae TaxID=504 RepID=UPI00068D39EF|nr:endonuclease NucS domain-containing protein [Kingella kingae]MDK4526308.1 endonuclease NucS [Kingella kingae]MDK4530543.1 endonuclease NucS [Kingella kingae]MDK4532301.1 endonuclease NucS [Kingella kingae]MDK4536938.1 endonuclease NucS [Kingella kingae]MDK4539190.1 endonuclease NucS [Kingella kingae]
MYQIDISNKKMNKLNATTFSELNLSERYDIQEWIDDTPEILGEKLLIIGKEIILPSGIRLDLLAIDENGNLVIIELKRDTSGNHVEWQAIKYASYCSAFTDEEIFKIHQDYLNKKYNDRDAKREIENFLVTFEMEKLNKEQRIILVSRDFNSDVASAVLWLNDKGLDIKCIKINSFISKNNELLIYPTQIIPLPEAEDFIKRKAIQRKENSLQQYDADRVSFDIPEYSRDELKSKLSDFLSKQINLKERFIAFFKILLSENREFHREEIKEIFFNTYEIGNDVQHAGRLLSNVSQAITRKANDFLRQLIKFGRDYDHSGAYKHSYFIPDEYRHLVQEIIDKVE